jgi:hypothetical protein
MNELHLHTTNNNPCKEIELPKDVDDQRAYYGHMQLELPPPPKWQASFLEKTWIFTTAKNTSWWFRFWTKFFFGAQWTRL